MAVSADSIDYVHYFYDTKEEKYVFFYVFISSALSHVPTWAAFEIDYAISPGELKNGDNSSSNLFCGPFHYSPDRCGSTFAIARHSHMPDYLKLRLPGTFAIVPANLPKYLHRHASWLVSNLFPLRRHIFLRLCHPL